MGWAILLFTMLYLPYPIVHPILIHLNLMTFLFALIFATMENGFLPPWKFVSFSRSIKWRRCKIAIYKGVDM